MVNAFALNRARAGLVLVYLLAAAHPARAFDEPSVNLGASSFFDGTAALKNGEADPGFYFNQYGQWYTAHRFNDAQGHAIPGTPRLEVATSLTQLIYLMDKPHVLGGRFGFDALIPVVGLDARPGDGFLNASPNVLGDLTAGLAYQSDLIMYGSTTNPLFMHRIDLDVIVPTGHYDRNYALNPGANFLSFNPYWAGTLFLGSKVVSSWRLHYLWNDVNNQPYIAQYGPNARVQAGQAVHLNFDLAYDLYDHRLYAGMNSYYFKQLNESQINGISAAGTEERVFGIGPGAAFRISEKANLLLNVYFETAVENRPSGTRLNAVFAYHF